MNTDDLETRIHNLLFGVRRSIRYHYRRMRFFDNLHGMSKFLSALSGTGTLAAVLAKAGPAVTLTFAACVTFFSVIDLVIGTAQRARAHNDFAKRYFDLEKDIVREKSITDEIINDFIIGRLNIESDEPPPYRVLDAMCHNEMIRACGYDQAYFVNIKFHQRLFAQFCDIGEHTIKQTQCK